MTHARVETLDSRIVDAVVELQTTIQAHHPSATFDIEHGADPDGIYVWTHVDTDDPDGVLDCVVDRLLQLQIDDGLPVHVIPIRGPVQSQGDTRVEQ